MIRMKIKLLIFLLLLLSSFAYAGEVSGELKKWHKVSVTFNGPSVSEDANPNPFLDYRLNVTFTAPSGKTFLVPGFYTADGDSANSSASSGNKWRVHFAPSETGAWSYIASFRQGSGVAIDSNPNAGSATSFDGESGSFVIADTDKTGVDLRGKGLLRYTGGHYLRFAEKEEYFLKGGADSPENFLGYFEFDGTSNAADPVSTPGLQDGLHRYTPHVAHWTAGDPTWSGGKGRGIIGAINYLSSKGGNSIYFLTYNVDGGDGSDTWPWTSSNERKRFDVSKLDQWEIVFSHMTKKGIQLHVVLSENENDTALGGLTENRKLYYRELVARFSHHLALIWNIGEESDNSDSEVKQFAQFIRDLDPYDHPITVHTHSDRVDRYNGLYDSPHMEATSIQGDIYRYNAWAKEVRQKSANAGRKWVVFGDESYSNTQDVKANLSNLDALRKAALWGNLMGGGSGVEWYFGYQGNFGDVQSEDWSVVGPLWDQTAFAIYFMKSFDLEQMSPNDSLVTGVNNAKVLARVGDSYAIYLENGGNPSLQLPSGSYMVKWFDPKTGQFVNGSSVTSTGNPVSLGSPPFGGDAAILVASTNSIVAQSVNVFQESNGIVVMEAESVAPVGEWRLQTSENGYTGNGYYNWVVQNSSEVYQTPGQGVLEYSFNITNPGDYTVILRSNKCCGALDAYNDAFVAMNNGPFVKMFKEGTSEGFDWAKRLEPSTHVFEESATYTLAAGVNKFKISARSANFKIDRIHIYNKTFFSGNEFDPTLPESTQSGVSITTTPNNPTNSNGNNYGPENPAPGVDPAHCWVTPTDFSPLAKLEPTQPFPYANYTDLYAGTIASDLYVNPNPSFRVFDISTYSSQCVNLWERTFTPSTALYLDENIDTDAEPGEPGFGSNLLFRRLLGNNTPIRADFRYCDGTYLWQGTGSFEASLAEQQFATRNLSVDVSYNNELWLNALQKKIHVLQNNAFFESLTLLEEGETGEDQIVKELLTNEEKEVHLLVKNNGNTFWLAAGPEDFPQTGSYQLNLETSQSGVAPFAIESELVSTDYPNRLRIPAETYNSVCDETTGYCKFNQAVNPGDAAQFSFTIRAPETPGSYTLYAQMVQVGGNYFGERLAIPIEVTQNDFGASCTIDLVGENGTHAGKSFAAGEFKSVNAGSSYRLRIHYQNGGQTSWNTVGENYRFELSSRNSLPLSVSSLNPPFKITEPSSIPYQSTGTIEIPNVAVTTNPNESTINLSLQLKRGINQSVGMPCSIKVPVDRTFDAEGQILIIDEETGTEIDPSDPLFAERPYLMVVEVKNKGSVWAPYSSTTRGTLWNGTGSSEGYLSLRDGTGSTDEDALEGIYTPGEIFSNLTGRYALRNSSTAVESETMRRSNEILRTFAREGTVNVSFSMIENGNRFFGTFGSPIQRTVTVLPRPLEPRCESFGGAAFIDQNADIAVKYFDLGSGPVTIVSPICPGGSILGAEPTDVRCNAADQTCRYRCNVFLTEGLYPVTVTLQSGSTTVSCTGNVSVQPPNQ